MVHDIRPRPHSPTSEPRLVSPVRVQSRRVASEIGDFGSLEIPRHDRRQFATAADTHVGGIHRWNRMSSWPDLESGGMSGFPVTGVDGARAGEIAAMVRVPGWTPRREIGAVLLDGGSLSARPTAPGPTVS